LDFGDDIGLQKKREETGWERKPGKRKRRRKGEEGKRLGERGRKESV